MIFYLFHFFSLKQKYKSNASLGSQQITIKTERDVEKMLNIKREVEIEAEPTSSSALHSSTSSTLNTDSWQQEKQSLVEKIASLKAENQKCTYDLNKSKNELQTVNAKYRDIDAQLNQLRDLNAKSTAELNKSQHEIEALTAKNCELETKFGELRKDNTKLIRENSLFQARFKQVQDAALVNQIEKSNVQEHENESNNEYEVDRLLDDKFVQNHVFLVRWKGYDSSHDEWVDEKNISSSVLKKYKKLKRK